MTPELEWIKFSPHYTGIEQLHSYVVSLGLSEVTRRSLIDYLRDHGDEFPHVKMGGKRYTKTIWVAEWLESFREPASLR